jgi:hypothetical protein
MTVKFYKTKKHWGEGFYKVLGSFSHDNGRDYFKAVCVEFNTSKLTGLCGEVCIRYSVFLPGHNLQTQIDEQEFLKQFDYAKNYLMEIALVDNPEDLPILQKKLISVRSEKQTLKSASADVHFSSAPSSKGTVSK